MAANIGLGCVTFGREIDKAASFALMDHALGMGVTHFDTAAAYSNGLSETIVGEWLAARDEKNNIDIATKILPPYNAAGIRESVQQSLKRLQLDTIDLLYLHRWDTALAQPEAWLILNELIAEGKIKNIGASNFNTVQLADTLELLQGTPVCLSYIQNNHNLAVNDISLEMMDLCDKNNVRIITYSPLGAGFLTGKHLNGVQKNSRFDIMPAHQDVYSGEKAQRRLNKLMQVAKATGHTPALLAMAWAFHQPQTDWVLIGGRSTGQLDLATEAIKFYDADIFAELERD
ncbi:aldo/keto reductase [Mucilaginibacter sp. UYCu711]|uniref:aldo/keto reductase n=1 Tax=Mucilaginibacter sp. UYCu711 TaxID=3156339 RepID=UPI003D1C532E